MPTFKAFALIALTAFVVVYSAQAGSDDMQWVRVARTEFSVPGNDPLKTLDSALADVPALLKAYTPGGVKVNRYAVTTKDGMSRIDMSVSKTVVVGFIPYPTTQDVRGALKKTSIDCTPTVKGFAIDLDLAGSSRDVTNNARHFRIQLCPLGQGRFEAKALLQKGPDFGTFVGPIVVDLLAAQAQPLVTALKARLKSVQAASAATTPKPQPAPAPAPKGPGVAANDSQLLYDAATAALALTVALPQQTPFNGFAPAWRCERSHGI